MLTFPQCKHDVFLADHPLFFFFDIYIYYLPDLQWKPIFFKLLQINFYILPFLLLGLHNFLLTFLFFSLPVHPP